MEREKIYLVEWTDSNSQQGWHDAVDRAPLATVVSVGFLTYDGRSPENERDDRYVTLTASVDEHAGSAKPLGDSISIPAFAIKSMTELTPKRASASKPARENGAVDRSAEPAVPEHEPTG